MDLVLESPRRPDTPEARKAGDIALRSGLAAAGVVAALASGWLLVADALPPASAEVGRALPFASSSAGAEAWHGASLTRDGVTVAARGANGAVATVAGGADWRDYRVTTRVRWTGGRAMALHVRETGPGDFVACVIDGGTARIDELSGGVAHTLASARVPARAGRTFDAVVEASGDRVTFAVDHVPLASAEVRANDAGTIGLAVWDPEQGRARLTAEGVRVEQLGDPAR